MLEIPYVQQINDDSCGAAVLEMVYKFYDIDNVSQEKIFNKYNKAEPHETGHSRIDTESLVEDAKQHSLQAYWKRVDLSNIPETLDIIKEFVDKNVPIIVCQKFRDEEPLLGHFRVVIAIDDDNVYFHDSHPTFGGQSIKWSKDKFIEYWQPTGQNVTGGVYVVIEK